MARETATTDVLIIGDEILNGETREKNLGFLAGRLRELGIRLREARVVADVEEEIVGALRELAGRYDYVFTSGGIGPTHDDITCASVARAFGRPIVRHDEAHRRLAAFCAERGLPLTPEREKMARVPEGAELIVNAISVAPGFSLENVYVMAGIPRILESMFEALAPTLRRGTPLATRRIDCRVPEGTVAAEITALQDAHPDLRIGSYPYHRDGVYGTTVVIRGEDAERVEAAEASFLAGRAASRAW